ncbi:MAG: hypothetical protein RR314_03040 [Oscillospiraceae bacterium]
MLLETLFSGVLGAALYGGLELLWRGRTHWTMLLAGGLCFSVMYLLATRADWPLWQKWLCSAAVITTVEFVTGAVVNLRLGWDVWDYSDLPLNLCGQICLLYSAIWFLLAIPGTALCSLLKHSLF